MASTDDKGERINPFIDGLWITGFLIAMVALFAAAVSPIWIDSDLGWAGWVLTAGAVALVGREGSMTLSGAAHSIREETPAFPLEYYVSETPAEAIIPAQHVLQIRAVLPAAEAFPLLENQFDDEKRDDLRASLDDRAGLRARGFQVSANGVPSMDELDPATNFRLAGSDRPSAQRWRFVQAVATAAFGLGVAVILRDHAGWWNGLVVAFGAAFVAWCALSDLQDALTVERAQRRPAHADG